MTPALAKYINKLSPAAAVPERDGVMIEKVFLALRTDRGVELSEETLGCFVENRESLLE